jgi:3-dehydroquinate dehydratase
LDGVPSASEISQDVLDAQGMGDSVKVCYHTNDRKDALRIFESALQLKTSDANFSLMGLGPGGDWGRIHAPVLGQDLVFATTESGWHLAQQGRINASDLRIAWEVLEYS